MARQPSLHELQARARNESMEHCRDSLERRAASYGLRRFKPGMDIWKLAEIVHDEEDNREWPELEKRAKALGVPTRGLVWRRESAAVALDCYAVEEHRQLLKRYGYMN